MLHKKILTALLILSVSLAVKYAYLQERRHLPDLSFPSLDSKYHDDWALGLATNEWQPDMASFKNEPFFRAPLYPYFLSVIYKTFGHERYTALFIQIFLGSISALLLFLFTQKVFAPPTAWIAFILYLGYWPLTYFEGELLIPVIIIFLDLCLLLALIWAGRKTSYLVWILPGCLLGLSALARPNILIVAPFVIYWIFKRRPRKSLLLASKAPLFFLCAVLITVAPVTLRNALVGKDFVLIASQGGVNFFIGNNEHSDGVKAVVPGTRADWWGGYYDTKNIAEESAGSALRPSQVSNYWFKRGLAFLSGNPTSAMRLYSKKIVLLLGNGEVSNNTQLYFKRHNSKILGLLPVNFALILSFSILGLILIKRKKKTKQDPHGGSSRLEKLLPHYLAIPYAVSIVIFFITSRYRLPLSLFLFPSAAYGFYNLYGSISQRRWKNVTLYSSVVLPIFIACSLNPYGVGDVADSRGYYKLGVAYTHTDLVKARESFDLSIASDSTYAPAWKMRGWTFSRLDLYDEAIRDLKVACSLDTTFVDAYLSLGYVFQVAKRHNEALPVYERVLQLDPDHKIALNNIADIYLRMSEFDKAFPYLERALEADPNFQNAIFGMGYYHEKKGDITAAASLYKKILELPAARLRLIRAYLSANRREEAAQTLIELENLYPNAPDIPILKKIVDESGGEPREQ